MDGFNQLLKRGVVAFSEINRVRLHLDDREIARAVKSSPSLKHINVNAPIDSHIAEVMIWKSIIANKNIKVVDFSRVRLSAKHAAIMLNEMKQLEKLKFSQVRMNHPIIFGKALGTNRNIRSIVLEETDFGDVALKSVARSLRFRSSLRSLEIKDYSGLTDDAFIAIGDALQGPSALENVRIYAPRLVLSNMSAAAIASAIERNTDLSRLSLYVQTQPQDTKLIFGALARNRGLQFFFMLGFSSGADFPLDVARVLNDNDVLQKLSISPFNERNFNVLPISEALVRNKSLASLCLSHCGINAEGLQSFCDAHLANPTLTSFKLASNILDGQGISSLQRLLSCTTTLKHFLLMDIQLNNELISLMCSGLEHCKATTMERFSLHKSGIDDIGASLLARSLKEIEHIPREVLFPSNNFGEIGAKAFADLLAQRDGLEVLDLSKNDVGDDGCAAIGTALLEHNKTLKMLDLSRNNNVGRRGIRALLNAAKAHPALTELSLPGEATAQEKDELTIYLGRNKGPKHLLKQDSHVPLGLWPRAFQRADNFRFGLTAAPDMLYYLVKEKCELFDPKSIPCTGKRKRKQKTTARKRGRKTN